MKEQIAYCCKKLRLGRKIVDVFEEVEADNNQEYLRKNRDRLHFWYNLC